MKNLGRVGASLLFPLNPPVCLPCQTEVSICESPVREKWHLMYIARAQLLKVKQFKSLRDTGVDEQPRGGPGAFSSITSWLPFIA